MQLKYEDGPSSALASAAGAGPNGGLLYPRVQGGGSVMGAAGAVMGGGCGGGGGGGGRPVVVYASRTHAQLSQVGACMHGPPIPFLCPCPCRCTQRLYPTTTPGGEGAQDDGLPPPLRPAGLARAALRPPGGRQAQGRPAEPPLRDPHVQPRLPVRVVAVLLYRVLCMSYRRPHRAMDGGWTPPVQQTRA